MNWYKKAQSMYLGDCRSIDIWDATEMAQIIENSKPITAKQFTSLTNKSYDSKGYYSWEYGKNDDKGVVWAYDLNEDIHYFYELV